MEKGKGARKGMEKGKGARKGYAGKETTEWWKVFLGHIRLDVTKWQIEAYVTAVMGGVAPDAVPLMTCQNKDPSKVGLNSAFIEFQTPGRLSQIDGVAFQTGPQDFKDF